MGMFLGSIKSLAGDCEKTHRWCLANLTGDDANDTNRQKLTQLRITKIGTKFVTAIDYSKTYKIEPARIQRVW